jgi:hypothetical protein
MGELDTKESAASVRLKYEIAYWLIAGKPIDRGGAIYQNFALLTDARNLILHLKPDKMGNERVTKLLNRFELAKLIGKFDPDRRPAWVYSIGNSGVAEWACKSAACIIELLMNSASSPGMKQFLRIHAGGIHYCFPHPGIDSLKEYLRAKW